jgi:kynureninase
VTERLLPTGHSHQAWPDVARHGQTEALDATTSVHDECEHPFARPGVRAGVP